MDYIIISYCITDLENGVRTYLAEFECPCLDVPFSLWDAAHVIVDEETFGSDAEDQTIRHVTLS